MEFHKILVSVNGTEVDDETVRLACRLARKDKGKIWAVYVIEVKRALPLDAELEPDIKKAEAILDHTEEVAKEEGYKLETDLLQARDAGPTIVEEATERKADLIVMGIEHKEYFGQFSLGSVVPYVLENSPCQVVLYQKYTGSK